jgi:hypothetical protein
MEIAVGIHSFNDNHPPSKRQPSIFRAACYRSAVCSYDLCRRGEKAQDPLVSDITSVPEDVTTMLPRNAWNILPSDV